MRGETFRALADADFRRRWIAELAHRPAAERIACLTELVEALSVSLETAQEGLVEATKTRDALGKVLVQIGWVDSNWRPLGERPRRQILVDVPTESIVATPDESRTIVKAVEGEIRRQIIEAILGRTQEPTPW